MSHHRYAWVVGVLALAWLLLDAAGRPCPAAGPVTGPRQHGVDSRPAGERLRRYGPAVRPPEIVEMLWAMAHGSGLGPGEGWFHGGQSRYGWDWLAARYDADHNGTVTRKEFGGPPDIFDRLDRNRDGVLTAADFNWSDRSPLARQAEQVNQWFRLIDTSSNGLVSRAEWEAFFKKASKGKRFLTPEDLQEALRPPAKPDAGKKPNDGPSLQVFLYGLLTGELGSFREGPDIGRPAPDFTLKTHDGKQQIRLGQYHGKKPVVLVFGSFT